MKLAISNIGFAAQDEPLVYAWMQRYGFTGLEVAPTRLVGDAPYEKIEQAAQTAQALRDTFGFCIPSLQSIWFGRQGNLFCPEDAPRLAQYTAQAASFSAAVGCPSLVLGCPRQRSIPQGAHARDAMGFFTEIATDAHEKGCCIALEANPAGYGTNFCNTSAEAFAFAREIVHLRVNYDMGTALTNGESLNALDDNFDLVSHIHVSAPGLEAVTPHPLHKELAALLRARGYAGFLSVEMKTHPANALEPVLAYVAEVFA